MRSLALFLLLSVGCAVASDKHLKSKDEQAPIPVPLVAASQKTTTTKGFGSWGLGQCDADGNLYYHTGFIFQESVVLKLPQEGPPVVYHPSDEIAKDESFAGFYVSPDGKLWLLVTRRQELYLLEAGDDPTTFRRTKLEMPPGAGPDTVTEFVVSQNGASLLAGYFDSTAPKSRRGHGYLIQFAASGNPLHTSVMQVPDAVVKLASESLVGESVASSSDGLNYFLTPDRIIVTSQSGETVRYLKLHPPDVGAQPSQIYAAGGKLLIAFIKVAANAAPGTASRFSFTEYRLVDPATGEQLRRYRATPDLDNLACFSGEVLTFYRVNEQGYVVLATVPVN